ncbi:MAG: ABC transporter ATP-binding protein [Candidatus Thermoplasmatota archaeon]
MIIVKNLTKKFWKRAEVKGKKELITAIDNISFEVKNGEIFGLIGPTGAGKTTTLKILSTLILPEEGEAVVNGYDVVKEADKVKAIIGVLAGEFTRALYWRLSGRRNLEFFAKLRNMWNADQRIDELLNLFGLKKWENELVMKYSTGMKHKLALAMALLNNPPILILDEPLTGIDPLTAFEIKKLVKETFGDKTIIWTSHNLYEIEEMCDRLALINNGKIVLEGSPIKLRRDYWDYEKLLVSSDYPDIFLKLGGELSGKDVIIKTKEVSKTLFEIFELARANNVKIRRLETLRPTLEEIFIKCVKNV